MSVCVSVCRSKDIVIGKGMVIKISTVACSLAVYSPPFFVEKKF